MRGVWRADGQMGNGKRRRQKKRQRGQMDRPWDGGEGRGTREWERANASMRLWQRVGRWAQIDDAWAQIDACGAGARRRGGVSLGMGRCGAHSSGKPRSFPRRRVAERRDARVGDGR